MLRIGEPTATLAPSSTKRWPTSRTSSSPSAHSARTTDSSSRSRAASRAASARWICARVTDTRERRARAWVRALSSSASLATPSVRSALIRSRARSAISAAAAASSWFARATASSASPWSVACRSSRSSIRATTCPRRTSSPMSTRSWRTWPPTRGATATSADASSAPLKVRRRVIGPISTGATATGAARRAAAAGGPVSTPQPAARRPSARSAIRERSVWRARRREGACMGTTEGTAGGDSGDPEPGLRPVRVRPGSKGGGG